MNHADFSRALIFDGLLAVIVILLLALVIL
jgi:hypothetical protein